MAKDHRLALDRYIDFTKDPFLVKRKVDFDDSFGSFHEQWMVSIGC